MPLRFSPARGTASLVLNSLARGPQGIAGDAATIEVGTVTTGNPGTSATVTNSGTSSAAVFDFVIPRGADADAGINVKNYGAVGDGVADDSAALNAAATFALSELAAGRVRPIFLPAGIYYHPLGWALSALIPIVGVGRSASVIKSGGAGVGLDIVAQVAGAGSVNTGHYLRDFSVVHATSGGTYGIRVRLPTGAYCSYFSYENLSIGSFGTRSLYLDNSAGNSDGFFVGRVVGVSCGNGWKFANIGDSLTFANNQASGTICEHSQIAGSRPVVYYNNNVSTTAGMDFNPAYGLHLLQNHVELSAAGGYTGSVNALVRLNNCGGHNSIIGNRIGLPTAGTKPNDTILFSGTTTRVVVDNNELAKGNNTHIRSESTTSNIRVRQLHVDSGTEVVTLAGTLSDWADKPVTGVGDANYTLDVTDRVILLSATLTATRTLTLPAGANMRNGAEVSFVDAGAGFGGFGWTIQRASTDTIDGATSVTHNTNGTTLTLRYLGNGLWTKQVLPVMAGGTGAATAAGARTNLGLGTSDSPQFAGVNVGHASDTTITRTSAGVIAVAGSALLRAADIGSTVQAFDADLSALAALSGTNTIYYRSGANTWSAVTIAGNLGFSAGTLGSALGTAATKNTGTSGNVVPLLDANNTFSGVTTFTTAASAGSPVVVQSTSADAAAGPILQIHRASASPADFDVLGYVQMTGMSATGVMREYASFFAMAVAVANGAENGQLSIVTMQAGVSAARVNIGAGMTVGNPTGGDKGADTINLNGGYYVAGNKIIGARSTGWTAQTAAASKADLGASPTVGQLASWASAIQSALTTHGLLGA